MSFKINWSDEANISLANNVEYLRQDWNEQVVNSFLDRVKEVLAKIHSDPQLFPVYSSRNIYKFIVTPQITLYYKMIDNSNIGLITFWNVYQDPKKLKL